MNGDAVTVKEEGSGVKVGTYMAKATEITGEHADCYEMPEATTHSFEIKKAPTKISAPSILKSSNGKLMPLKVSSPKQTKRSITLNWKKVKNASQYVVYGNRCDVKESRYYQCKLETTSKNSFTVSHIKGARLVLGKSYKFTVVAYNSNGKVIEKSQTIHIVTKGGKSKNYTGLKIKNPAKGKAVIRKGKTLKIKATATGKNVKKHVGLMYQSSNNKVAKVTKKGVIKAVKKGTCNIYVCTQNGIYKTIKVTVK